MVSFHIDTLPLIHQCSYGADESPDCRRHSGIAHAEWPTAEFLAAGCEMFLYAEEYGQVEGPLSVVQTLQSGVQGKEDPIWMPGTLHSEEASEQGNAQDGSASQTGHFLGV